ncbi:MAG: helix-turn-helix transcriptional regulator [Clostridia bacterium]|nr:helix-turn-helix transcriptional regulator [Clostridia bacterium]
MSLFIYLRTRLSWTRHLAWALFSLTLILVSQTIDSYLLVNSLQGYFLSSMDRLLGVIGCTLCIYFLPHLSHSFFLQTIPQKAHRFFVALSIAQPVLYILYELVPLKLIFVAMASMSLLASFSYMLIQAYRLKTSTTADKLAFVRAFTRLMIVFIPYLLLDIFIEKMPVIGPHFPYGILSVPLFFLSLNGLIVLYGYKTFKGYFEERGEPAPHAATITDSQAFYETYKITAREKEVIELLISGSSYNAICEALHISLSTTKRHVYNIYQKTGVSSKMELLNLMRDRQS